MGKLGKSCVLIKQIKVKSDWLAGWLLLSCVRFLSYGALLPSSGNSAPVQGLIICLSNSLFLSRNSRETTMFGVELFSFVFYCTSIQN